MSARPPRLHLVSPTTVEHTLARLGISGVLSDAERAAFERLALDRRRRDWLAGRVAAKRVVRAAARADGEPVPEYPAITVWNDAGGAPGFTVAAGPGLGRRWNISIAHADGAAAAALACTALAGTVGVDLERTRSLPDTLIRRVLTADEARRFDDSAARRPAPLVMWTIKEAVLKAGRGGWTALRHIELAWTDTGRISARVLDAGAQAPEVDVAHCVAGPYTIALALRRCAGRTPPGAGRAAAGGHPATDHATAVA